VALAAGVCYLAGAAPAIAAPFVYVTNGSDNDISQFDAPLSSFESLVPLSPAIVSAGAAPSAVATSPDGRHVYVADGGDGTVSQYIIASSTGALTPLSPATVAAGRAPTGVALSPDGRSAYVTNQLDGTLSQYDVDPLTGALSPKNTRNGRHRESTVRCGNRA
jgi:YVTN family beta-propeller protein